MARPRPSSRWGRVLGNPFVLGSGALVIAVAAAIGVAIVLGRGGADSVTIMPAQTGARDTPTPRPITEAGGPRATAKTTLTVRSGPGIGFVSLGLVARGAQLEVVAKSDSEQWLEVIYPPRSRLKGWVQLEGVEFSGDLAALPVGGAEVFALPAVPTSLPIEEEETVEATPESTGVDLVSGHAFVAGRFLLVEITNAGSVSLEGEVIDVAVYDGSLSQILDATNVGPLSLAPGDSFVLRTGFQIEGPESRRVVIVVNPAQRLAEADYSNNSLVFVVTGVGPTETPERGRPMATVTPTRHPLLPTFTPTRRPAGTSTPTPRVTPTPTLTIATETPTAVLPVVTETPTASAP